MIPPGMIDRLGPLSALPAPLRDEVARRSAYVRVPAGSVVFSSGQEAANLLFVLSGGVRVSQTSESGREVVLYRVSAGESCVMTTACLLAGAPYSAEGVAETDVEAVAIPQSVFDDLAGRSSAFRAMIFEAYARRLTDLFQVIDDVAFGRVDIRLAQRLVALAAGEDELRVTHQQLAAELGTAREVVSRQLQEFQRRGWIAQSRGRIEIADRAGLARLAGA